MPWPQTSSTQYHAKLGFTDKGRANKGLVVCNDLDLEPLYLQNGLALGCYQPSPEVLIELRKGYTNKFYFGAFLNQILLIDVLDYKVKRLADNQLFDCTTFVWKL